MKLEVKKTGEITRQLNIEVSQDSLKEMREKSLNDVSKKVTIPGFRKGKAPADLVSKKYPDLVKEELLREAVPFYYNQALDKENIQAVGIPAVKDVKYAEGTLSFSAQVDVMPEIKVEPKVYKQVKLKTKPISVEDKEITTFKDQFKEKISQALGKKKEDVDDKFLAAWSGYKDDAEFTKTISSELYLNSIVQRRREIEKQITEMFLAKIKFSIPVSLVEEQKKSLIQQQILNLHSRGVSEEEIKKHQEEIQKKSESLARDQVRLYYILEQIAKQENLKYDKNNIYEVVIGFILSESVG